MTDCSIHNSNMDNNKSLNTYLTSAKMEQHVQETAAVQAVAAVQAQAPAVPIQAVHKLHDEWTMWAHLPHDTDWTVKSYKKILTFNNVETIIALLMIVNSDIKEHRIQVSLKDCLKGKRTAERQYSEGVRYQCLKSKAELEKNIDGSWSIKALIME